MADAGPMIQKTMRIEARPETIFPYFTDPDKMIMWGGMEAELDPRPGGIYKVQVTHGALSTGEYLEVTPYSLVRFSWGWEGDPTNPIKPGSSTVEISLEPDGEATLLTLTHTGLPADAIGDHENGWDHLFERLVILAEGGDPGPDPWHTNPPDSA